MELHFREKGRSELPLVLIHAFPLDHTMWTHQLEGLSERTRVIAVDAPGFGKSHPLDDGASMESYAEALRDWLDVRGIPKAVFAGCSMGGYILFELMRQDPGRAAGLILCDTRAGADTDEARQNRMNTIDTIRSEGLSPLAEAMIPKLLGETSRRERPELVKSVEETILNCSTVGVIHAMKAMAGRPDSTPLLESITVPALVAAGEEDALTPPELARKLAAGLRAADCAIIPRAGHLAPLENPEAFNEAAGAFLTKYYPAG